MADDTDPTILDTAVDGWRLAFEALSRMPVVLGAGIALTAVLDLAVLPLQPFFPKTSADSGIMWGTEAFSLAYTAVYSLLLTPVAIAVHRFVLLGEVTDSYAFSGPRFMRFFYFSIIFQMIMLVPSLILVSGMETVGSISITAGIVFICVCFALFVVGIIVSLRLLILFPALAVDAGGAGLRNAMADARGHSWRVFFIVLLALVPFILIGLIAYYFPTQKSGWPVSIVHTFAGSALGVLMLAAYAAIASKLFAAYANRLNLPPAISP